MKYVVNEMFFEEFTPDSVYILGWIVGDGHVCYPGRSPSNKKRHALHLCGSHEEQGHVQSMLDLMGSTHPLVMRKDGACEVQIGRKALIQSLLRRGFEGSSFMTVPDDLVQFQIRAYFESDGCICGQKRKSFEFGSARRGLLEYVHAVLLSNGVESGLYDQKQGGYRLQTHTKFYKQAFNFIYGDPRSLKHSRKHKQALSLLD